MGLLLLEESEQSHWMVSQNILQPSFSGLQFVRCYLFSLESESELVTRAFHKIQSGVACGFFLEKLDSSVYQEKLV